MDETILIGLGLRILGLGVRERPALWSVSPGSVCCG